MLTQKQINRQSIKLDDNGTIVILRWNEYGDLEFRDSSMDNVLELEAISARTYKFACKLVGYALRSGDLAIQPDA
jgi:hypothetical protein